MLVLTTCRKQGLIYMVIKFIFRSHTSHVTPGVTTATNWTGREAATYLTVAQDWQGWTLANRVNRLFTLRRWSVLQSVWGNSCLGLHVVSDSDTLLPLSPSFYLSLWQTEICSHPPGVMNIDLLSSYSVLDFPFLKECHMVRRFWFAFICKQSWIKYKRESMLFKYRAFYVCRAAVNVCRWWVAIWLLMFGNKQASLSFATVALELEHNDLLARTTTFHTKKKKPITKTHLTKYHSISPKPLSLFLVTKSVV